MIKPRTVKKYTTTIVIKRVNTDENYCGFCDFYYQYLWSEDVYCMLFNKQLKTNWDINPHYGIRCCFQCNNLCNGKAEITEDEAENE